MLILHKRVVSVVCWNCVKLWGTSMLYMYLCLVLSVRIQITCSWWNSLFFFGLKKTHQSLAGTKQSVDIFLAYRRDARRAANDVWHSGTQSGSCEAGTAGLGNLQSAWGSRLCCTADIHNLLLGNPGHRWKVWGKKMDEYQMNHQRMYVCTSLKTRIWKEILLEKWCLNAKSLNKLI